MMILINSQELLFIRVWTVERHGLLSEVDNGGPCTYDPSVTSTTTTVWEPFLNLSR